MRTGLLFIVLFLLSLSGYSQSCTLNVNLTSPGTAICSGTNVILTASASAGTAPYTYNWSTGETTPTISVNKAGTYTVTVGDNTAGCSPVKKSITITSTATPAAPTAGNVAVCQNTPATLTATAPGGTYQWYDAATGGNFLASGASYTTPPVSNTSVFFVETTVAGCTSPRTPVYVFVYGPPAVNNNGTCTGNTATLTATGYTNYLWYDAPTGGNQLSTAATYTPPPLTSTTTYYVAAIINGCTTPRAAATIFITPAPAPPTATGTQVCTGNTANLHADAPAGNIDWFDVPTGGTSLITSPDFTTPGLTSTTTYYVQVTTGCVSARTPVTVTVTQTPQNPTVTGGQTCSGTSARLNAATNTPGAVLEWYIAPTGSALLFTGSIYDTPILTKSTTYYVQANNSGCISGRTPVQAIVTTPPNPPTVAGALICAGTAVTLTATAPGGTYQWYDAPTAGNLLFTGPAYTTPALSTNTTYYVQTTDANGCISQRSAVTVTILPVSAPPSASGMAICSGNSAMLTATGGGSYQWYDAATGGNKLADGQVYNTPALLANTTYYVQATSASGCISTRTAVTVTVNTVPAQPSGTGDAVCTGTIATLKATTTSGTIAWYNAATGGNLLATGPVYTTPPLANTTTYYAEAVTGTCTSIRTPVVATIITGINPQFQYPYNTVCSGSGSVSPLINNPAGGVFSASPAGLVFVSNTTGEINTNISLPGTYTILFANNGACPGITTTQFTIGITTNAQFTYNTPFCQGGVNPLPIFPGQYSAGTFTASAGGLIFVNTSTGEIDLAKSTPGTYTIKNTIGAAGACALSTYSFDVTINPIVKVSAGTNQAVPAGSSVQLAGSISGGTTSGTWTGGAGSFNNPTLPNAIYTPAAGETSAVLTLTSADPPGPCGVVSSTLTITFSPAPAAPTVAGKTICAGNAVTLSATAPGGSYQWYANPSGGSILATGADFITPVLTASTTYYVATTLNGATSNRTAVTVTVNPLPLAPVVVAPAVCTGATATLTVSNPGTNTYQWYDAATGGNLLANGSSYVTGTLYNNTSFFVEAGNNGCTSSRTEVIVVVNAPPNITSADADNLCSGTALNYSITADISSATFLWNRAQVTGISNTAVSNQTSATITETLLNTTTNPIDVTYTILAIANNCSSAPFTYIVKVYPTPLVTSTNKATICNGSSSNYTIAFNTPVGFSWGRAAVPGISNAAVSGQAVNIIHESLFNTTNAPIDVTYAFNYAANGCVNTFNFVVTVNPPVAITSAGSGLACSGIPQAYNIQSNIAAATYNWNRAAVAGISNSAVSNQASATITEVLINTTANPVNVFYTITPSAFGCDGGAFTYMVTVNPIPVMPVVISNSPVCVLKSIQLNTPIVNNATYQWTGPNGYTSTSQNPVIPATAAAAGDYTLTVITNGCYSPPATVNVVVNDLPVANAGPDQTACITSNSIQLAGSISGGTTTGEWSTSGSGTFSPSSNAQNGQYIPSAQDKAAGSVRLTLISTSKDDCAVATDDMTITFGLSPASAAGADQDVCSQVGSVPLNGAILVGGTGQWSTSGTGTFSPAATQLNALYLPSAADVASGKVTLTLTATNAGACYALTDDMLINLIPPATVNAGGIRYVLKGNTITLNPVVSDENVTYLWSPNIFIDNVTLKNPVVTGDIDRTYTVTITDSRGCTSTDQVFIKVSPELHITNTFTPNGDGINDVWTIAGLAAYEAATVDIFNRNGTKLFHSVGYGKAWDGNFNGKPVPVGVYYYSIDTRVAGLIFTGYVAVIR